MKLTPNNLDERLEKIKKEISEEFPPITFQELEKNIKKWLLIKDENLIRVLTAAVIANKMTADPLWLFIIAGSGGSKSELLRGLNKVKGIYHISDLTPQTLISGEIGRKDASLLMQLPKNPIPILTFKDFTSVLTMQRDKRHAILGQLREIYDGYYKKPFGTGQVKEWHGKLGLIAGVTSVIDNHYAVYQTLGERFIQYRPIQPEAYDLAMKSQNNSGKEVEMREEIQDSFAAFIENVKIPTSLEIPEEYKIKVAHLASFCAVARSGIERDYTSREIDLIPDPELPTRLAKQLSLMFMACCLIEDNPIKNYKLVIKLGLDSLPKKRRSVLRILIKATDYLETSVIAAKIGYPTNTTRRVLEDLHGLKIIKRLPAPKKGMADGWRIKRKTLKLIANANVTVPKTPNQASNKASEPTVSIVSPHTKPLEHFVKNLFN